MVVERLVWKARFGQGDAVVAAFKEFGKTHGPAIGAPIKRLLVDAAGPMFVVVAESEFADLSELAQVQERLQTFYAVPEFQAWFGTWCNAVESGSRELFYRVDA
jgi:hypothetical protein